MKKMDTQTFRIRTLTAIIFAIIMLVGLLWNRWAFAVLFIFIHFGCWLEFIALVNKITGNRSSGIVPGVLYITLPIGLLFFMRLDFNIEDPLLLKVIPCGIVFSLWVNDTMAYITGSLFGKTPLSKISPKKTWEGTLGGIILCILVITLAGYYSGFYSWVDWIFISAFSAIAGTFGDLLESKLKRLAGVKDSGSFMPGHGGFLDRFDSLLVAVPFVFVYYYLILRMA